MYFVPVSGQTVDFGQDLGINPKSTYSTCQGNVLNTVPLFNE